jgi:hypothetical protein
MSVAIELKTNRWIEQGKLSEEELDDALGDPDDIKVAFGCVLTLLFIIIGAVLIPAALGLL